MITSPPPSPSARQSTRPLAQPSQRPAGVLFAEDFDAPHPAKPRDDAAVSPPAPLPDIEAIRREAFARGRDSGLAELDAAVTARAIHAQRLLAAIEAALGDATQQNARVCEENAETVARLVLGMVATMLPSLCARHGAAEVAALARSVLPALSHVPRVAIRVGPSALDALRGELARLDPELRSRITLTPTEAVPNGDVRITWEDGSASREAARLRRGIGDALAPLGLLDSGAICEANQ